MGVAARAIKAGRLVVLPTDTVYGVGADAFSPDAVRKLLDAKGRGPDMPVPVLVGSADAWTGVAVTNEASEALAAVFWPGGLSLLCHEQPSLDWNLGDTGGTVVVRMPEHDVALELLRKTGPMGVSSANLSGQPPARSAQDAREQLGDAIAVYLEAGMTAADVPSTIVDVTGEVPRVVRAGAISLEQLREVVPEIIGPEQASTEETSAEEASTEETSAATVEPTGTAAEKAADTGEPATDDPADAVTAESASGAGDAESRSDAEAGADQGAASGPEADDAEVAVAEADGFEIGSETDDVHGQQAEDGDSEAGDSEAGDSEAGDSEAGDSEAGDSEAGDPEAGGPEVDDAQVDGSRGSTDAGSSHTADDTVEK